MPARSVFAVALAVCVASCGGTSRGGSPCPARVPTALGGAPLGRVQSQSLDVVTCAYRAPAGAVVRVTVDTAPQAQARFGRWVDERGQAYLGAPRAELPDVLSGIGDGAAWVPAARELVAVGRERLVTVLVLREQADRPSRATAVAVARAALATAGASDRGGRASNR